jgi:hypothetical protein
VNTVRHKLLNSTQRLGSAIHRLASLLGHTCRKPAPVDFRGVLSDPLEALRRADARQPVVLNVPLDRCRTLGVVAFPPTVLSGHPYVLTAQEYLAGNLRGYSGSPLQAYYESVQPETAVDLLDVPDEAGASGLRGIEALQANLPWLAAPGPDVKASRFRAMQADAAESGMNLKGEDGWNPIGPISPAKAEWEISRTIRIVESIRRDGYWKVPLDKHIPGYLLRWGTRYCAMIWGGEHRMDALAALGYDHVPLLFYPQRFTDRASVKAWPGVVSAAFTCDQALYVFDRVFEWRQPRAVAAAWPAAWYGRDRRTSGRSGEPQGPPQR